MTETAAAQQLADPHTVAATLCPLIAGWGAGSLVEVERAIGPLLTEAKPAELAEMLHRLRTTGGAWGYHPADPIVREISRRTMALVLREGSRAEWVRPPVRGRKLILMGNHLSYVDVNVFDRLVAASEHAWVAEQLTTVVGPKVYIEPIRRLASLCFATIKIAQSAGRASGEAVMSPREVARIAAEMLAVARERVCAGDHLLLFPEGVRSRRSGLERCLPAVARYLEVEDLWILPWGHWGTEGLVPLDEDHVYPTVVSLRVGAPRSAAELVERAGGSRRLAMDVIGFWIADLLPPEYRGSYGVPSSDELCEARALATELCGAANG
jgi:1-acyl-sn-glycerol-3-phosphate acyltransferase